MPKLISDLAIMLLTAGVVAVLFKRFKLPLVLGYILAGSSPWRTRAPSRPGARSASSC